MTKERVELWKEFLAAIRREAKTAGFRSSGQRFYRLQDGGNVIAAFSYQRHERDIDLGIKFCVNLELVAVRLLEQDPVELLLLHGTQGAPAKPVRELSPATVLGRVNSHWRERLVPEAGLNDYWWLLNAESQRDIMDWHRRSVSATIAPTLENYGSEAALLALWTSGTAPGLSKKLADDYRVSLSTIRG